jgi:hypothetical protein
MSWDEVAATIQLVVRGVLSYAPLVGTPTQVALHAEDAAYQRLILVGLDVRSTAEKVSLVASRSVGCA